jgi:DNA polymerase III subunit delta
MAKSAGVSAIEYLAHPAKHPATTVCAVTGDDAFLKSAVLVKLRSQTLSEDEADIALTTLTGKDAQFREMLDALATMSLFGNGRRMVIVEEADPFVSEYRPQLEDYVARPFQNGVLVLEVKTWPSNTKLARAVAASGLTIDCKSPDARQTKSWISQRAKNEYKVQLDSAAVDALLELLPPELGILDQELAKLTLLVQHGQPIDAQLVRDNVGGWRTRTTWEMVDAAADGQAAKALGQLDRLISAGEKPHGLLPQMSSALRRFSTAVNRLEVAEGNRLRMSLRDALVQSGVPPFKLSDAERQLRHLGRGRAKELVGWLLAADVAIKSHNSSDQRARIELERLIVRLA